ncbi:TetR family transcriptional regulator [Parafilimonas sp.]|uniref:TetR/AcrR family transcriptional regulator n=1 Tax=Parafilimonas sp. TaxID=1969739 RepID=UPI003F8155A3
MVKIKDLSTEQKILEAARQVFFDKGMHGARMQDIADKAGINKAMLHYYFRSKDKLFETIFTDASNHFFPMLNAIIESDKTVFEKIEVLCIEYINQVGKMPYLPVFILSEASRQQQVFLKKLWTRQKLPLKSFTGMIETAVREKKIKPVDPLQLLMNILSLCIFPFAAQPIFQHAAGISRKEYETMIEERKKTIPRLIIQSIKK